MTIKLENLQQAADLHKQWATIRSLRKTIHADRDTLDRFTIHITPDYIEGFFLRGEEADELLKAREISLRDRLIDLGAKSYQVPDPEYYSSSFDEPEQKAA